MRLEVPKTAGHEAPFYPQALERGRRSCRAVMLAVAEMYIKGVSTRDAEAVMREFGLESLSSSQVSRAAKLLDGELDAWRNRPLGEIRYLLLDARYEKVREGGVVRDAAVLSVIGIGPDQRRRVLGVSCALSEAEVHWRAFLETLVARGMRGVAYIVSDDHPGLGAARKAVLGGAVWQRCQYHLAQNAIHHAPNLAIRKAIGKELRRVWNAADGKAAEAELGHLVAAYRDSAPKLADWLETAIPEGLAVFALPERHQKRMRTSNPMERSIQQEIKRRTVKVRVFPTRLQVGENQMDDRQVLLGNLWITTLGNSEVLIAALTEASIAAPIVSNDQRSRRDGALDEPTERLGATVEHDGEPNASGIASVFPVVELGARLSMTHLDGTGDENLVVNTTAFPTRSPANPGFVHLNMVLGLSTDPVLVGPHHARAELVENLKGRLVARKTKLPLKLHGGHAGRLTGDQISGPEPDVQRSVATLHHCSHRQPGVLAALAAAQDARAVFKVERLSRRAAVRAGKAVSPAGFLQVGGAGRIIGEKSLELG